jgi:DHA1 family inner membrane transport protein
MSASPASESAASASSSRMPPAVYALTAGAFGIGTTEFVIMGLLEQVAADLGIGLATAGLLISGYALGVFAGAPLLTLATGRMPRKAVLVALMLVFTVGNLACALAPDYGTLMAARVLTSLAHGTFFGVGAVVATGLVVPERRASAISAMFTGLTVATLLGVPAGAWLGLRFGWRSTFWAVAMIGVLATVVIAWLVPRDRAGTSAPGALRRELKAVASPQVLLGLLMTVLGFGGMFTVYTYIQPILTRVTGFADAAISPILLVFGVGMIAGNLLGGRWADRRLKSALLGTLLGLALVMGLMGLVLDVRWATVLFTGLLGAAAFATVSPLQLWVLQQAGNAQSLASSLNIGAFNLGNAIGAWLGGVVIAHGGGLTMLPFVAALVPLAAFALAALAIRSRHGDAQDADEDTSAIDVTRRARGKLPGCTTAAVIALIALLAIPQAKAAEAAVADRWIGAWQASPQPRWEAGFPLPVKAPPVLERQSIRQVVRLALGGARVRVEISNACGTQPLRIGHASLGRARDAARIEPRSLRQLTFAGRDEAWIPTGASLLSDPVALPVVAGERLAVSLYLPERTPVETFHWEALRPAYVSAGDSTLIPAPQTSVGSDTIAFLSGVQVEARAGARAVVAIGDSITDGAASTPGADGRWTDALATRLAPSNIAVLNAGISGARLLQDKMGANALARFDRDVLAQPKVDTVIVLLGINDIGWPGTPFAPTAPRAQPEAIIGAYRQLIARARARGVRIVGATLPPFADALAGSPITGYYDMDKDAVRRSVNAWIRASDAFDAVLDFDALLRDPADPSRMAAVYDSGDHLHPGDAGYAAMGAEAAKLFDGRP